MGEAELQQLMEEEEVTRVTCDYCVTEYVFQRRELQALLSEAKA
jgi:redox-regulated HSP33 family molecular chaperone